MVVDWLLEGDPAIRWQTMRDLLDEPEPVWRAEQARVATEGWGARLLSHQDAEGRWTPRIYGKKWISTTYSMLLLRHLGLPPGDERALRACRLMLDEGLLPDGGVALTVSRKQSDDCGAGFVLSLASWFGLDDPRVDRVLVRLLGVQLPDGGWNCMRHWGHDHHSSFHTTMNVLDGLRDHGGAPEAEARGREFLLAHRLYRSHRTGEVVDPKLTRLSFPPRWRHDVLRALDHFRAAGAAADDERLTDAVAVVEAKRRADGRWPLQAAHPGAVWFEMEEVGAPSRWNTLRALRVLRWYRGDGPRPPE